MSKAIIDHREEGRDERDFELVGLGLLEEVLDGIGVVCIIGSEGEELIFLFKGHGTSECEGIEFWIKGDRVLDILRDFEIFRWVEELDGGFLREVVRFSKIDDERGVGYFFHFLVIWLGGEVWFLWRCGVFLRVIDEVRGGGV